MATVLSWQVEPSTWDRLRLGNDWLPGPVTVDMPDIDSGLDVRKAPKTNRSQLVDQGYNTIISTIEMTIGFDPVDAGWSSADDQFTIWQRIFAKIRPKRAQKRVALTISHPIFNMAGVSTVYVKSVSGLKGKGPGVRTVTIKVYEQAPIVSASAGVTAVGPPKGAPSISSLSKVPKTNTGP